MEVEIKGFICHKAAEKYSDCYDRYAFNTKTHKFAVSDGVSKSFFPGIWAELLVNYFTDNEKRVNIGDIHSYKAIQSEWIKKVTEIVNRPDQKYFVRNFFIQGRPAAATFVGLHFFLESGVLKWESLALGDSFLFFVPKDNSDFSRVICLSSKKDFEFNNFPDFFDSRNSNNKGKIRQKKHDLQSGTFYLMTDAMSEWFLTEKHKAIQIISNWKTQDEFERNIIELRKKEMHNDDCAILTINVVDDKKNEINYSKVLVTDFHSLLAKEKEQSEDSQNDSVSVNTDSDSTNKINPALNNLDSNNSDNLKTNDQLPIPFVEDLPKKKGFWKQRKENWEKRIGDFADFLGIIKNTTESPEEIQNSKNTSKEDEGDDVVDDDKENKNAIDNKGADGKSSNPDEDISSITNKF